MPISPKSKTNPFFFYDVNKTIQGVVVLPTQKQVTRLRQQAEQILF
jgi:hypothetical protein